jgi:hypothetical protein
LLQVATSGVLLLGTQNLGICDCVKSMFLEEPFFQSKKYESIGGSSSSSILCVDWVGAADAGGFPAASFLAYELYC